MPSTALTSMTKPKKLLKVKLSAISNFSRLIFASAVHSASKLPIKTPIKAPKKGIGIKMAPSKLPNTGIQVFSFANFWPSEAVITKPLKIAMSQSITNQISQDQPNQCQAKFKQIIPPSVAVLEEKN